MTERPNTESPDWLVALRAFGKDAMALESVSIEAQTAQVICDYIDAVTRERDDVMYICPTCGFRYGREHFDESDPDPCPVCAEQRLMRELDAVTRERDLAETANTRLHIVAEGLGRGIDDARSIIAELTRERDALSSRLDDFISARATGRSANDD